MGNNKEPDNKSFVRDTDYYNSDEIIVKKCHTLDGKYFIVIDESIIKKIKSTKLDESKIVENEDYYFNQELKPDGSIVLSPINLGDTNEGNLGAKGSLDKQK